MRLAVRFGVALGKIANRVPPLGWALDKIAAWTLRHTLARPHILALVDDATRDEIRRIHDEWGTAV